ncbi:MAG: glycosyltransferase family 2 protein, partial [Edaphobacter sp.]
MIESDAALQPLVCVVVLNWNGWRDTIECLESVFRLDYVQLRVVVCDNASSDDSMEKIEGWANGHVTASCNVASLAHLVSPPIPKPVAFESISALGAVTN